MLRTTLLRNELLRETLKKSLRINTARTLSVECTRRRHRNNNQACLLKSAQKAQWKYEPVRFYADLPPHQKVTLPALSPTMDTGTIISWEKKEGDKLNEGDLLAEIETDKATMGFETPEEGYLAKIVIPAGSKNVPIGKLVCIIVQSKNDVAAFKDFKDDGSAAPPPPPPKPSSGAGAPPPAAAPPAAAAPAAPAAPGAPGSPSDPGKRVYASPMAKRLAEQRKIRLEGLKGTGLYGSITSKDLPAAGAAHAPGVAAPPPPGVAAPPTKGRAPVKPGTAFTDTPISSMRSTIAKRLTQSKQTIPHYYLTTEVNVDELIALRARFNEMLQKDKIKLSINDFLIKAMAITNRKVPEANSIWMDTIIREFHSVDVSVAVSTDKGLITPIVFNADSKGVIEISHEVKNLAAKARANKLQPHEFQGGTITISNVGMFGVNQIAAIVNPPQSLILGVGKTTKKLVIDDSEKGFKQTEILLVTASCDHRTLDGAVGAKWLSTFRDLVEDPAKMIL